MNLVDSGVDSSARREIEDRVKTGTPSLLFSPQPCL